MAVRLPEMKLKIARGNRGAIGQALNRFRQEELAAFLLALPESQRKRAYEMLKEDLEKNRGKEYGDYFF